MSRPSRGCPADASAPRFPFHDLPGVTVDPEYVRLRCEEPLTRVALRHGGDAWLVTRYDDVCAVLSDPRFSRAATLGRDVPRLVPLIQQVPSILTMDPPEHTRHRSLVSRAFTPRRIEGLRPTVEAFAEQLVDGMVAAGPPVDLVEHLSRPLPVMVMCELLGIPYTERELFYQWSEAMRSTGEEAVARMRAAGRLPWEYLAERIAAERQAPSGSLLGNLVHARDAGGVSASRSW